MGDESNRPDKDDITDWLESAPDIAKAWLRENATTSNMLESQRNRAFQMIGKYDGAISSQCQNLYRNEYEFLRKVIEWCRAS